LAFRHIPVEAGNLIFYMCILRNYMYVGL